MKKLLLIFLLLVCVTGGIFAQSDATVRYNGVEFSYAPEAFGAVLPTIDAGTPYQTDAPYFANIAPHTAFYFTRPNPELPELTFTGELRVYKIADLEAYAEPSYMEVVNQLRSLDMTTLADFATVNADYQAPHLPFMPVLNATQVMRAHPAELNVGNVRGIEYYAYYSQGPEPIVEGQVMYTFQGITTDGLNYVSFSIYVDTGLLPAAIPQDLNQDNFVANYSAYLEETFTTINQADPTTFNPAPNDLHHFIESLSVEL